MEEEEETNTETPYFEIKKFINKNMLLTSIIDEIMKQDENHFLLKKSIWNVSLGKQDLKNGTSKITLEFITKL